MMDHVDLPAELRAQLLAGRTVPFLGAGIGLPCGLPDWRGLLEKLLEWAGTADIAIPHADQIRRAIEGGELDAPAHALSQALGADLDKALIAILTTPDVVPTAVHRLLASVAWPIVLTTNFDNLLPEIFAHRLEPITWQDSERLGNALRTGHRHLMLAHGWIGVPGSIVLAPAQYRESFHSPTQQMYLRALFSQYTLLFVGCSLRDVDIRFFLEESRQAFGSGSAPHYALLPRTEIDDVLRDHYRENFNIHILTYDPSAGHPEVEEFVRKAVDVLPPELLFDPSIKGQNLDAARAAFSKLPPDQYLRKLAAVAREVSKSGFSRTAWTALKGDIQRAADATPQARLSATVELVELMRADYEYEYAVRVLQDAAVLRDDPTIPQEILAAYARTAFATYLEAYCLKDANDIWQEAERFGLSPADIDYTAQTLDQVRFMNSGEAPRRPPLTAAALALAAESLAQAGDLENAIASLAGVGEEERVRGNIPEALQIENTRAHLLYWGCRLDEAWQIFEVQIAQYRTSLSVESWAELQQNRTFVGFPLRKDLDTKASTASRDSRGRNGDKAAGSEELLFAESASREQKHYDSLPPLWRELRRSYSGLSWSARERAHHRLAWETFSAGWIRETVHHAIMGNNVPCLKRLAEYLIIRRDLTLIKASVDYLSSNCQLLRHAKVAAEFVSCIADVVPEADIPTVIALLRRTALVEPGNAEAEQCVIASWKAIAHLAYRLDEEQSVPLLRAAQDSPVLKARGFVRESVLKAIRTLSNRVTHFDWDELVASLLPAAIDRWDFDYEASLRALEAVATKSATARERIREQLYKSQQPIDVHLAAYAVAFGAEVDRESLARMTARVAEVLWKQVTSEDQGDFPLSHIGTLKVTTSGGDSFIVQMLGGQSELRSIAVHQNALCDEQLNLIVEVVLSLLAHPSNNRANRLMLMDFLHDIRRRLSVGQAQAVFRVAYPLAMGSTPVSPTELPDSRTTDRFQFNSSSQTDEQANALHLIVSVCGPICSDVGMDLPGFALKGLLHPGAKVRQYTCVAMREFGEFAPELEAALVTAALDPDWSVAGAALHSATILLQRGHLRSQIPLLTTIAAKTLAAEKPLVRALAARLVHDLRRYSPTPETSRFLEDMRETLSTDVSYQVRAAARHGNATETCGSAGDED